MAEFDIIAERLRAAVPFVRTLDLEFVDVGVERAVLRLPDRPALHNHVGGPHAGALFTLGESATGAVVLGSFADLLDLPAPPATPAPLEAPAPLGTYIPLAQGAQIRYRALARGPVTAEARLTTAAATVRKSLATEGKARFDVEVVLRDDTGTITAEMTVTWALRPNS